MEKIGVLLVIIVGVGYLIEGVFLGEERCYDFMFSVILKDVFLKLDGKLWFKIGGVYNFFIFIEEELKL